jgi:nitrite reductase/ring-hydroxylating ferredoxin subunit
VSRNLARPPPGVRLCALAEIADPGAKGFRFRDGDFLFAGFLVRKAWKLQGFVDSCPHAGWPLSALDDRYLTRAGEHILCTGHGALFRPDDGVCVVGPCLGERLAPWAVTVLGGEVFTA